MILNLPCMNESKDQKNKSPKVCASCRNFRVIHAGGKRKYECSRLGFETFPQYAFDCWDGTEKVRKRIDMISERVNTRDDRSCE